MIDSHSERDRDNPEPELASEAGTAESPVDSGDALGDTEVGAEETPPDETEAARESEPPPTLEGRELKGAIEAILFSLSEPIGIRALSELLGASLFEVREAVEELRLEYCEQGRSFRIEDIAGGVQMLTLKCYDPWIRRLRNRQRQGRLSPAALETLAVIAYKQPINRAELEAIRGVNCGAILKTLLDKGLVKIVGRGEGLGRPLLYGTTQRFLESFGIASVRDLPQPDSDSPPVVPPKDVSSTGPLFAPQADAMTEEKPERQEGPQGDGVSGVPPEPPSLDQRASEEASEPPASTVS